MEQHKLSDETKEPLSEHIDIEDSKEVNNENGVNSLISDKHSDHVKSRKKLAYLTREA